MQAQSNLETLYSRFLRDKVGWKKASHRYLNQKYLLDQVILPPDWSRAAILTSDWLSSCTSACWSTPWRTSNSTSSPTPTPSTLWTRCRRRTIRARYKFTNIRRCDVIDNVPSYSDFVLYLWYVSVWHDVYVIMYHVSYKWRLGSFHSKPINGIHVSEVILFHDSHSRYTIQHTALVFNNICTL